MRVRDGYLELAATTGDIYGTDNGAPSNFVLQDLGDEDWTVETLVDGSTLTRQYEQGGLMVYVDDDNYVKFDISARNSPGSDLTLGLEVLSEVDGVIQNPQPAATVDQAVWYLRLEKSGDSFTGSYSADGEEWTPFASVPNAPAAAGGRVGLFALGTDSTDNQTVTFDYFRVLGDEPEPEPEPVLVPVEKVSIGLYSLIPWVNEDGLPSVLARLAEIGLENIEPFGGNLNPYTADQFADMADTIGLQVPSSHYNVGEADFDATLEYVRTLGQEYVGSGGFPAPGIGSYEDTLATAEAMDRLGERSVEAGVGKLFGHNHAGEFTTVYEHEGEQLSAWEILVRETNPEYVTFQVDVAWAAHAGVDVAELLAEYGERIELLHIKDATGLGGNRPTFTNLGEGDVPLQEILAAAEEHADIAYYVLEYDVAPQGEDFVETGFEYLTGLEAGEQGSRPVEVTPGEVTFADEPGTDSDSYTVPWSVGVEYLVDGEVVDADSYPGSGEVTVTARALDGFVIADGADTEWSHTFSTEDGEPQEPAPDRRTAEWHLSNTWRGSTDAHFMYGRWADEVFIGDWDGDGRDTIAVRRGNQFHVTNSQRGGDADVVFHYGRSGDVILVGDWDGDGRDSFAVRRGANYHINNSLRGGNADTVVTYGRGDDTVLVGDWDGDGTDTFAVRRGATYHVKNSLRGGDAELVATYGRSGDVVLVGDWDGDGDDTLAVQRGRTFHVNNSLRGGDADQVVTFGRLGDQVLVGDWDGNGTDTLGIRRPVGGAAAGGFAHNVAAKVIGMLSTS